MRINLNERFHVSVQAFTHDTIGFVVAPCASGSRTALDGAANQLAAEFLEFLHPRGYRFEMLGVRRPTIRCHSATMSPMRSLRLRSPLMYGLALASADM